MIRGFESLLVMNLGFLRPVLGVAVLLVVLMVLLSL